MCKPHIAEIAKKTAHCGHGWLLTQTRAGSRRVTRSGSDGYAHAIFDHGPNQQPLVLTASNDVDRYPYPVMKALSQPRLTNRPAPPGCTCGQAEAPAGQV